jgi:hypothetical protein
MGAIAEKPTLPHLKSSDFAVRQAACDVLQAVGTEKSLKALKKLAGDTQARTQAQAAFYAIQARVDLAKRQSADNDSAARQAKKSSNETGKPASTDANPRVPSALRRVEK